MLTSGQANTINRELGAWAEKLRKAIVKQSKKQGFFASGRTDSNILVGEFRTTNIVPGTELRIPFVTTKGDKRTEITVSTWQTGRKPGKAPPRRAIRSWIQAKGITARGDQTIEQQAYVIAKAIEQNGDLVHQKTRTPLDIESIVGDHAQEVAEIVGDAVAQDIGEIVEKYLPVKT